MMENSKKVIDLSYLNEISGGDKNFIREMLELFISTTATEALEFDPLLVNGSFEQIGHLAHKMKAPIQMLGANDLFNLVREVERCGKEHTNLDRVPSMIAQLKQEIDLVSAEIQQLLQEYR